MSPLAFLVRFMQLVQKPRDVILEFLSSRFRVFTTNLLRDNWSPETMGALRNYIMGLRLADKGS